MERVEQCDCPLEAWASFLIAHERFSDLSLRSARAEDGAEVAFRCDVPLLDPDDERRDQSSSVDAHYEAFTVNRAKSIDRLSHVEHRATEWNARRIWTRRSPAPSPLLPERWRVALFSAFRRSASRRRPRRVQGRLRPRSS